MFVRCPFHLRLLLPLILIHTTCILLSLRRSSAPIHLTSVLGVLGTQETSCILIAGLLERTIFDLCLPEFDKPWVIHLRETSCCSTNLCTSRPNTVYTNRSVCRHQGAMQTEERRSGRRWAARHSGRGCGQRFRSRARRGTAAGRGRDRWHAEQVGQREVAAGWRERASE